MLRTGEAVWHGMGMEYAEKAGRAAGDATDLTSWLRTGGRGHIFTLESCFLAEVKSSPEFFMEM